LPKRSPDPYAKKAGSGAAAHPASACAAMPVDQRNRSRAGLPNLFDQRWQIEIVGMVTVKIYVHSVVRRFFSRR
jgi:hypothetical protein